MGFLQPPKRLAGEVSDEFAAAQKSVFLPVEKYDHCGADLVPPYQPCAFETHRERARIIICPRCAGHGIVMRAQQNERAAPSLIRSHDDVIVGSLQGRRVAKAARQLQQQISGSAIGLVLGEVMARERQHLHKSSKVRRRNVCQNLCDGGIWRCGCAIVGMSSLHRSFRLTGNQRVMPARSNHGASRVACLRAFSPSTTVARCYLPISLHT